MVPLLLQERLFHISDRSLGMQMLLCADQPVPELVQLALEFFSLKNKKEKFNMLAIFQKEIPNELFSQTLCNKAI